MRKLFLLIIPVLLLFSCQKNEEVNTDKFETVLQKTSFEVPRNVVDLQKDAERITGLPIDEIKDVNFIKTKNNNEVLEVVFISNGQEKNYLYLEGIAPKLELE